MWSSLLVLALPIALDPVRLGLNLLLVSRPRPAQNLLMYWVGCALVGFFWPRAGGSGHGHHLSWGKLADGLIVGFGQQKDGTAAGT